MKLFKYKIIFLFIVSFFVCFTSNANDNKIVFDSANSCYAKGDYEQVITQYESILNNNFSSAELYYNLGNAYYKTNNIGLAILNYERAKKLNPHEEDLITNLKIANQKIEDKIEAAPILFLTEWKNSIIDIFSAKEWSILCIIFFTVSLLLISLYFLTFKNRLKKLGFFGGSTFFILCILTFFIAQQKNELTINSVEVIITSPTATVTGSPNEKGTKLFILHEGTKAVITQDLGTWTEIKIANGNVGWLKACFLKKI
ncbi:MAG: tetratricopeptide repeat protein [Bacteroidetes bacterium]|nr:tetratricopeptide repeat protein [Bacteroidota bacterium]